MVKRRLTVSVAAWALGKSLGIWGKHSERWL